jgi:hypothetical protein
VILIITGLLCLALFVVVEPEVEDPLLDVRVFRTWPYTNSLLLISVLSVGLFAALFYIPVYLQEARGLGAFQAGFGPDAPGPRHFRPDADGRSDLRPDRGPLACGDRVVDRGLVQLPHARSHDRHVGGGDHRAALLPGGGPGTEHEADHDQRDGGRHAGARRHGERVQTTSRNASRRRSGSRSSPRS